MGSRGWAVVVVVVMALAAGCGDDTALTSAAQTSSPSGSGPASSASATTPATTPLKTSGKPCELLTGADVAGPLGLGSPPAPTTSSATECVYEASNGLDSLGITVEAEVFDAAFVDTLFKALNQEKAVRVDGLGDAAFVYRFTDLGSQLHVWAKGKYLTATVIIASRSAETEQLARSIIDTALARL